MMSSASAPTFSNFYITHLENVFPLKQDPKIHVYDITYLKNNTNELHNLQLAFSSIPSSILLMKSA